MALQALGVAARLAVLALGQRGLRHQGPDAGVLGLAGQRGELLLGDPQVLPEPAQPTAHVAQTVLDPVPGHNRSLGDPDQAALTARQRSRRNGGGSWTPRRLGRNPRPRVSARRGIRTLTPFRAADFESAASASSAIRARSAG